MENETTDRLVFLLKDHEGFDFGTISEMTGIAIEDIRNSFNSGLKSAAAKIKPDAN